MGQETCYESQKSHNKCSVLIWGSLNWFLSAFVSPVVEWYLEYFRHFNPKISWSFSYNLLSHLSLSCPMEKYFLKAVCRKSLFMQRILRHLLWSIRLEWNSCHYNRYYKLLTFLTVQPSFDVSSIFFLQKNRCSHIYSYICTHTQIHTLTFWVLCPVPRVRNATESKAAKSLSY